MAKPIADFSVAVNAWWYGTRGADEAGDQAALQAALDAAALTNRACYIPRGIYRVTAGKSAPLTAGDLLTFLAANP